MSVFLSGKTEAQSSSHCKSVRNKYSVSTTKETAMCEHRLWGSSSTIALCLGLAAASLGMQQLGSVWV